MAKPVYAVMIETLGRLEMQPQVHRSARDAQGWIDWQRHRGDQAAYRILRCERTEARSAPQPISRWD